MAFKLTSTLDETLILKKISNLFKLAECNYVIQNDWSDIKNKNYKYRVFNQNLKFKSIGNLQSLCALIFQEIIISQENP